MRVLVTGSRAWGDPDVIAEAMSDVTSRDPAVKNVLVSGACPVGADAMAEQWAEKWGWQIERHPADWKKHGRRAGFVRNAEMVELGADVCLAFICFQSRGASMTAALAEAAGIPTCRFVPARLLKETQQ